MQTTQNVVMSGCCFVVDINEIKYTKIYNTRELLLYYS